MIWACGVWRADTSMPWREGVYSLRLGVTLARDRLSMAYDAAALGRLASRCMSMLGRCGETENESVRSESSAALYRVCRVRLRANCDPLRLIEA